MKVYISSTVVDLLEYRKAAHEVVSHYKCECTPTDSSTGLTLDPARVNTEDIEACKLFIGIYAYRYGFVPAGLKTSIIHQEYQLANKLAKPVLCFVIDDEFPWKPKLMEKEHPGRLTDFINMVKTENVISSFSSVEDFSGKLSSALGEWMTKNLGADEGFVNTTRGIPAPPLPYLAHPYPLPDGFVGRDEEREILGDWFRDESKPMLVMEAVGGMGKSALSWVWLQQDMIEKNILPDGVFWWSFYDEPFESFIIDLACYVLGKTETPGVLGPGELWRLAKTLQERRFLLVLDGLERTLQWGYGMESMFVEEKAFNGESDPPVDKRRRRPCSPVITKMLQYLSVGKTKTLITTRLMPTPMEHRTGVAHLRLKGLCDTDAVSFFENQGIGGDPSDMLRAAKVYGSHPLMLNMLTLVFQRTRLKNISRAFRKGIIVPDQPYRILEQAVKTLSKKERKVVSSLSIYRTGFNFEPAQALFPTMHRGKLWTMMKELARLGILYFGRTDQRFDFHPVQRAFLYHRLSTKEATTLHNRAVAYFETQTEATEVMIPSDLGPLVEQYYHLVKAGRYDEACDLFYDRIDGPTGSRFFTHQLRIDLLRELFPDGEHSPPCLKDESNRAWALTALATAYSLTGRFTRAVSLFHMHNQLQEQSGSKKMLAVGLGNTAYLAQVHIGQLTAAVAHMRKRVGLCDEMEDDARRAFGHLELGRAAVMRARTMEAENEFTAANVYWLEHGDNQGLSMVAAYRAFSGLLRARAAEAEGDTKLFNTQAREALAYAREALALAEIIEPGDTPPIRDFVRAYWLLGAALTTIKRAAVKLKSFDIAFYDGPFNEVTDTRRIKSRSDLSVADRCLCEALRRCRRNHFTEMEPGILIALAELDHRRRRGMDAAESHLLEAEEICLRAGYRFKLAEVYLLCGQLLTKRKKTAKLLHRSAAEHLTLAKDLALDVSDISHLYQSPDPRFYNGIPEYRMLQRGMTEEERIRNGYFAVYRMAHELEKKLRDK